MAALTKAIDLLYLAKQNGVDITLNKEELQLKLPKNKEIDKGLLDELRNNKQLIIDFLKTHKKADNNNNPIVRQNRESIQQIPLSFSQERLWFIDQMDGSVQYHIPSVLTLKGKLNKEALSNALQEIISRHEVLRTVFLEKDGQPYQTIRDSAEWRLEITEGSRFAQDQEGLQDTIQELIRRPFDLSRDYMVRAHLITLVEDDHVLVVTMHHIASDGWSISIIVKEVAELYAAYAESRPPQLAPLQIQYADYAIWQRNYLQGELLDQKVAYWKNKLSAVSSLQLPTDHPRPAVWSARGATRSFSIEKKLSEQIQQFSQQQGTTLFMTLLSAFNVLLHRYSGQQDICVGSPIANRTQQEVEGLIGFFVNTLVLRSEVNADAAFTEFLQQVKTTMLEAYEHQELPFEKIVETVVKERDLSRNPLFQVMFSLQNTPEVSQLHLGDVELSGKGHKNSSTLFDITFNITQTATDLQCSVQYATDLYDEGTIFRMMDHFKTLLRSVVKEPQRKIGELVMLTREEEQQLLHDFNSTNVDYPKDKSIVRLFEEQVAKTPAAIAVAFEGEELSYKELNEKANQLAQYLRSKGVKEETLVPLCIERSLEMIIGILGILKAGGAYVPIDPDYPAERIGYMVDDSAASIVLSSATAREKLPPLIGVEVIELGDHPDITSGPRHDLEANIQANQLAYVIYTSGSTGKPKGVMIEHHNMFSFISWCQDEFSSSRFDTVYASTSICFDLSIFEIFYPLSIGKTIRILENAMQIEKYLENDSFVLVNTVPVVIENLLNQGVDLSNVSVLNMAGEPVPTTVLQRLDTDRSEVRNLYGPTEDTTYSTVFRLRKDRPVLIGKPISNTKIYILDKNKQLTPIGVPGEICIAGEGVARGYLNRAELTAEKFIDDPIINTTSKVYRTGDLGRWSQDGNIEYLGRIDQQVKIRGYRIELGEIEAVIHESGLIQQAVVISKKDTSGSNQLVGYIVAKGQFNQDDLISRLREKLPQYMIPTSWVSLPAFPLTPNGKIDKKALPDPEGGGEGKNEYVAPGNEVERALAKIWQDVLSIPVVGVNDNFFEIGGHSLKAMRLISSIRKELGSELSIKELFTYPTIKGLVSCLSSGRNDMLMPPVKARPRPDFVPLSFSQERLWFIDRLEGSIHYHVPAVLNLKGPLNAEALSSALQQIVNRHEVLRTVIREEEGNPYQRVLPENGFQLSIIPGQQDQDSRGLKKLIDGLIIRPFDLANDHMLRATLIALKTDEHILVATMHHIASDAWSIPIVLKEVMEFYIANQRNTVAALPELEVQYADYAIWQRENLEGDVLSRKLDYWKKSLQGITPLQMPMDFPRPAIQSTRGASVGFRLDKELSNALQHLSQQRGTTLFMTMLASFNVLLHRYSQQQNICIGTPIAGRQQQELEALVGFFVNTLALHTEINGKLSFLDFLDNVKDTVLNGYMHQEVPFEKVVEAVVKERDMSFTPLFQVMFILQNAPEISMLDLGDIKLSYDSFSWNTSKFDLTFSLVTTTEGFIGSVEYCVDLFTEATITRMIGHFQNLLSAIAQDPGQKIGVLRILNEEEEHLLTHRFNDTKVTYPADKCIADLFEEQAEKTPDHIAVVFGKRQLTYRELNEKSNQFAHYLFSKGVNPQSLVPVCLERSVELIICVLGILKAGCAYVPIDSQDPDERIDFKLNETGAAMVVSSQTIFSRIQSQSYRTIFDVREDWPAINDFPVTNLNIKFGPHDLAYVIYTSGSTGKPKGVKMHGSALVNLLLWQEREFKTRNRRVLQFASINFDVSFQEIFSTLCFGSTLFLISEDDRRDPGKMVDHLKEHRITHLYVPYIMLKNLAEYVLSIPHTILPLEEIIVAGEQLKITDDIRAVLAESNTQLINQYGPTESHVVSSFRVENNSNTVLPPIGKPIDNTKLYILNDSMSLVPVGITGELYIGGVQVARGYLNRPELTDERFIPDPFSLDHKARLYKTGDLAKWMADGNIEFLGRADDQVKIRGYRVEMGEIESVLQQYYGIRQGVVLAKEDLTGNKRLVGYVVPENLFDPVALMSYLRERLPDYMVPTQWVEMKSLPVTVNGKVDRKALPEPDEIIANREYIPPANEKEEKLAEIWRKLLGGELVGRNDNFFTIGGHSLLAMRLISFIRKELNVELSIKELFTYPTIEGLAARLDSGSNEVTMPPLVSYATEENIPLSFSQERLWFIDQLEGSLQYHLPAVLRLKGNLDISALDQAFKAVLNRHKVLRSVIYEVDGNPFIRVKENNDLVISIINDFLNKGHSRNNELSQYISGLVNEPFDLSRDNMLRASLIRLTEDEHILVATMHHIASDGWSISILVREVVELYESFIQGRRPSLIPLAIQYPDYAIWQKKYLQGDVLDRKLDYWKNKLSGVSAIQLPTDRPRPAARSNQGAMHGFTIDKKLADRLHQLSQQNGVTLFMTLLGAFNVLLHRYSDQQDICVGTPTAGRQHEQLENLIGFFINTLALRTEVNREGSFLELLSEVRRTTLEAYEHQEVPFEKIVEAVVRERDMSRTPVFQVMFVLQNTPPVPALRLGEVQLMPVENPHVTTQFDLSFIITETSNGLQGSVNYSTDLYEQSTIARMVSHFEQLLHSVVTEPQQAVGLLPMLSEQEQKQLVYEFNDTKVDYPASKTIVDLFEQQVRATPDNPAVIFDKEILSYTALNEKANQIAHYLRAKGAGEGALVAICMRRTPEMIIGLLGVLKAGAAYVPIDPDYPGERKVYMLQDSGASLVICDNSETAEALPSEHIEIVELSGNTSISDQPTTNIQIQRLPDALAYVIYTSGSTGKPKGVMIEHHNVYSFICWSRDEFSTSNFDIVYASTSICFDLSIFEIFYPLSIGKKIRLLENGMQIEEFVDKDQLILANTVPVVVGNLLSGGTDFQNISVLNMAGEPVPSSVLQRLDTERIDVRNLYGPTEDTTYSTVFRLKKELPVLIGKPINNTRVYIIGNKNQLVPIGVAGEICLAGEGVTRGYLNRPELTAEKFVNDFYRQDARSKVYKTGDLGRWLSDGNIEYLGRIDQQVKVRGYRIEPGEIETVLEQNELVKQVAVLAKKDSSGNHRLVAYIVPKNGFDKQSLISYLEGKLPQYMVPGTWVPLETLPLTPNGKIDKKALPDPEDEGTRKEYLAPTNETEQALADIWAQLLSIDRVGISDNFFEVGGHSLIAMRLISSIRKKLKAEIAIKELFTYPTIKALAARLMALNHDITMPPIQPGERPDFVPLSFSQERLWYIDRLEGSLHYHMPAGLRLKGSVNADALNFAFQQIVNRHEVLRTVIRDQDGEPFQLVLPINGFNLELVDGSAYELHQLERKVNDLISKPYDLSKDRMIRASLIRLKEHEYVLAITMHHIASDGWSIPIVIKELGELYNSYIEGRAFRLPALPVQYADYAIWQRENLAGEILDRKLDYWKQSLSNYTPLQLPLDFPRPPVQSTRGAVRKVIIDKKISSSLDELAKRHESTLFMTLLAAFNVLLYRYTGQHSICVGTPIAGRQQQELEDLIGFFVNTLALRIDITGNESFINVLARVKETVLAGYTYQDVPFEKIVETVVKERDMARSPLFQVMFILQNATNDPMQKLGDVQLSYDSLSHTTSKFDITLSLTRTAEGFVGGVEYCVDLFTEATVDRMMQHFQNLLGSIVIEPNQHVGALSMLSSEEEQQLIRSYNSTDVDYPKEKTIINLFEEQVELTPDSPAVIFKNEKLSYKQLNAKANQLAYYLVSKGVRQESLVPLCAERSVEMIISVLAILKTGAAYVPIDPEYPQDLINFKLSDTNAGFIIVGGKIGPKIKSDLSIDVFDIDSDWAAVTTQPTNNLDVVIKPRNLVYLIYTSGSTGKPKGVQMAHTAMVNLLLWQEKQFRNKNRRVLQFASLNFDVSFQEIFSTLSFGSSLYLISEEDRRDPAKMIGQLKTQGITHLFLPYIVLKNLAEYVVATGQIKLQLEEIITAGEQLKVTDDIRILLAKGNIDLVNQYGPTEAHVVSSYRLEKTSGNMLPPIGKPIDNTQLYILSESRALVPVGIAGELCIGGVQVARGYLNRPGLTEEKFVADPFSLEKDGRMYRTGDLARWLPDGNIEYLGRIDDQVKIRGYRVEVGEIENILQEYHGVRQAVVKTWEDLSGQKQLIAYVVPEGTFDLDAITAFMKLHVPNYMLPAQWVKMESLPVTGNGKVDRKALPLPDLTPSLHGNVPPTNETEEKLLEIWQKLLGPQQIGIKNNFFEVGGHSLLAMRLIAAIRRETGVELPLLDIYECDIQGLAEKISSLQKTKDIDPLVWTGEEGTSAELTAALEMVDRMERGTIEWGANGHSQYLVPIRKNGTKNPFFGIISFNQYRRLGSLMPNDQPLFYLPPTRAASVEEIASHYIKEMKLSHPDGPYTIGGFCGSGMIALEIAQQLQAQGDKVAALILFEYYAPDSMIRRKSVRYKKRLMEYYKGRLLAYKESGYSGLDVVKFLAKKGYQQVKDFINPPPPKFITTPEYSRYKHKPYSGKVILFQASDQPLEATDSPLMGWSKYFSGDVRLITIPGGHLGIFKQPEIRKLAQELTVVLDELNNQEGKIE